MASMHGLICVTIICLCLSGCVSQNHTAPVKRLHQFLFHDYNKDLRPVYNVSTPTPVILRMVLRNLIKLDTRDQVFAVDTWMKFMWRDEFLRWNPDDFDGFDKLIIPVASIWSPDITLHHNSDPDFERYKPDSVVEVHPDGLVIWFTPAIYTTHCKIRVKWFPFDVQVCYMVFASWGYNGFELDLSPESTLDALTSRYIANGVWDMVEFHGKQEVVRYLCCPEPYPEVHYTMVFKRHSEFYTRYMVLPCLLLPVLSLLVFYLPPDCGEKLTLSITNLLALVVFQRIIVLHLPPSAEESPVLGSYFLRMIIMVVSSVFTAGAMMHLSALSQPVPRWIQRVFLDIVPRILCLEPGTPGGIHNKGAIIGNINAKEKYTPEVETGTEISRTCDINRNSDDIDHTSDGSVDRSHSERFQDAMDTLRFLKSDIMEKNLHNFQRMQWKRVSVICDRVLMYIFSIFMIVASVLMATDVLLQSEAELEEIRRNLRESSDIDLNPE